MMPTVTNATRIPISAAIVRQATGLLEAFAQSAPIMHVTAAMGISMPARTVCPITGSIWEDAKDAQQQHVNTAHLM